MSDLVDFSFLIIVLAVFGFMLKDAFYFSRKVSIPYEIRDKDDKIFSNVSLGLLIISLIFFFTAQYYLADPQKITEFIQFFFSGLFNLSKEGFITESNLIALIENITIGLYFLSWISFVFFVFFFLAFFFGIIALFFDNIAIEISFKSVDGGTQLIKNIDE
jgi:Fe2+ transport system protein B